MTVDSSFALRAAQSASRNQHDYQDQPIDKVVSSVMSANKRLSQASTNTNSSKRKSKNHVGPWKLGRTLGRGSTGRVRLAKHSTTGQLAAVKIVPKSSFLEQKAKDKGIAATSHRIDSNGLPYGIEREIIIMKLINHPNIMGLYDVWENKGELYLVLEYIEGGELFDYLIKNGRQPESEAVRYFKQIIDGVSYCHQFSICHRDLKPENLLLDKNSNIKIADFGMAALETKERLLETSCGSPHYASPEIIAGKDYHGSPSDVWSCGIILFALLTGRLPFDDPNIRNLLIKVQSGVFTMPEYLSKEAKDLITRMLHVDPTRRIKILDVYNHPLIQKYTDTLNFDHSYNQSTVNVVNSESPIDTVDEDILQNLQTLWKGVDRRDIISKLKNSNISSEKVFYRLLLKYRDDHSEYVLPSRRNSKKRLSNSLPRSTSIVTTTIKDDNGNTLESKTEIIRAAPTSLSSKSLAKDPIKFQRNNIKASTSRKHVSLKSSSSRKSLMKKNVSMNSVKSSAAPPRLPFANINENKSELKDFSFLCDHIFNSNRGFDEEPLLDPSSDFLFCEDETIVSNDVPLYNTPKKVNSNVLKDSTNVVTSAKRKEAKNLPKLPKDESYLSLAVTGDRTSIPDNSRNFSLDPRAASANKRNVSDTASSVLTKLGVRLSTIDIYKEYNGSSSSSTKSLNSNLNSNSSTTLTSASKPQAVTKPVGSKNAMSYQRESFLPLPTGLTFSGKLHYSSSSSTRDLASLLRPEAPKLTLKEYNSKVKKLDSVKEIAVSRKNSYRQSKAIVDEPAKKYEETILNNDTPACIDEFSFDYHDLTDSSVHVAEPVTFAKTKDVTYYSPIEEKFADVESSNDAQNTDHAISEKSIKHHRKVASDGTHDSNLNIIVQPFNDIRNSLFVDNTVNEIIEEDSRERVSEKSSNPRLSRFSQYSLSMGEPSFNQKRFTKVSIYGDPDETSNLNLEKLVNSTKDRGSLPTQYSTIFDVVDDEGNPIESKQQYESQPEKVQRGDQVKRASQFSNTLSDNDIDLGRAQSTRRRIMNQFHSIVPKRDAPRPPSHARVSPMDPIFKNSTEASTKETLQVNEKSLSKTGNEDSLKKPTWFSKLFNSLTKPKTTTKESKPNHTEVIQSSISSQRLWEIFKTTINNKQKEKTVSKVTYDHNERLISGVIPARLTGRALHFNVQIKDGEQSLVVITHHKGSKKAFRNLIIFVDQTIQVN
ncbi:Hypothetical protein PP7435_CHR3-2810 [Komagataella phaffii CBS 7435]|uniref:non-specific serine/threonine protein kinase n=1 Tax=Komagataella phaffii (strain ATCC 76273 / CBS 7435 / CECT 11047 / NRRL Y-11430 / Wegner 21-1) TaxID=981350 RepID=A0A1G4KQM4_KOMPC|nr:GQ67_03144T0 [Komagataella phaffii]AOA68870.1 GQ68_03128T0 [Komagataella phaffii GS115]CAH2450193.1 Hypothetical protein BQ9382_C3-5870 [Komagataella phaffii CBS 7435]SCV12309.1 Hypothetical protein PP7435_CHR3-2810 [Komagataella phaffii CBS 7435]